MRERKFITEAVKKLLVSEYIRKETESAGFGSMEMKRTPFGTNMTLHVNKPGLVIGRRGSKIQEITENLEKRYKVESPQIEVKEAENPDLNPQVVSKKIALSLEKGWSYRKAGNTSLRRAIDNDVRGIMIKVSGKLTGERSRTQKFFYGSVKYSGEPGRAAMLDGFSIAKMKQGVIGVTVKILDPVYRLPDEIDFVDPATVRKAAKQISPDKLAEVSEEEAEKTAGHEEEVVEVPSPEKKVKKPEPEGKKPARKPAAEKKEKQPEKEKPAAEEAEPAKKEPAKKAPAARKRAAKPRAATKKAETGKEEAVQPDKELKENVQKKEEKKEEKKPEKEDSEEANGAEGEENKGNE